MEGGNGGSKIAVWGASGFVGGGLAPLLGRERFEVTGVSRQGSGEVEGVTQWARPDELDLSGYSAVVNLAGEPVDQRWTEAVRERLVASRVEVTRELVRNIAALPAAKRPQVLVNASAVGYYGDTGEAVIGESSEPGEGFLASLCVDWEREALAAEELGLRVVCLRIGIVLGRGGQAFEKLRKVFAAGIGGRLGHGRQWMPWIHVDDLREAIVHALRSQTLSGPVNGTAPAPERNAEFTRKLAAAMKRPAFLPVPGFALKLALGDFAEALLGGQRALPEALQRDGFQFRHSTLESALDDLLGE